MTSTSSSSSAAGSRPVAVIGAGVMGVGIVQVAALAGHDVRLFDTRDGAAAAALATLRRTLDGLVAKGRLEAAAVEAALGRTRAVGTLGKLAGAGLVIEAIVEDLAVKQALLRDLEAVVDDECVLASNTSSLSITALARGLRLPGRVVGMHFFNPVPLMKLVEVVSGLATRRDVADDIHALARGWGKTPVHASSTPGFIVNRIARPYYAETLALLQERAASPAALDACLRGAGFRMGPCELMDLIGHDTNFAVTRAVYEANFLDKRFVPSLVQRDLVDGGRLGRKSGQGFFRYDGAGTDPAASLPAADVPASWPEGPVVLRGAGPLVDAVAARIEAMGQRLVRRVDSPWLGIDCGQGRLMLSDGRCAAQVAAEGGGEDAAIHASAGAQRIATIDWPIDPGAARDGSVALAYALADEADAGWDATVSGLLRTLGWRPVRVADAAGLPVARTIAMLINEASDAVHQGVCDEAGADAAMKLGVNYPAGPFEWLSRCGAGPVIGLLDALDAHYRGERYRVSPGLRRRAWRSAAAR
jgi:3-hydroxybutyryl-CoA dehydrogenase